MFFSKMRRMLSEHMLSLWKEMYDINRTLGMIGKWYDNKSEEEDAGPRRIKHTIRDTVNRAMDIWGLDYADCSDGLYPSGNQIGRRVGIAPQDVGLDSWWLSYDMEKHAVCDIIDCTISEDAFLILEGYWVEGPRESCFDGILVNMAGVYVPYIPFGPAWEEEEGGGYSYRLDPIVISPKAEMRVTAHHIDSARGNASYRFALLGQIVAKRPYLVRRPDARQCKNETKKTDGKADKK